MNLLVLSVPCADPIWNWFNIKAVYITVTVTAGVEAAAYCNITLNPFLTAPGAH